MSVSREELSANGDSRPPGRTMSPLGLAVRLALSAGLLWWVLRDAETRAALAAVSSARTAAVVALATLWYAGCQVLNAWKWGLILRGMGYPTGLWPLTRAYFVGQFFSRFLPTSVGGDVVRPILLARAGVPYSTGLVSAFLGRVTGLVAMLLLGLIGCLWARTAGDEVPQRVLLAVSLLCGLSTAALVFGAWLERRKGISRRLPAKLGRPLRRIADGVAELAHAPQLLAGVMAVSLVFQVMMIGINWLLGAAAGLELSLVHWFWFVPVVTLGAMLPSFGGLGFRENVAVLLLQPLGLAAPAAVCSLLWQAAVILASLPGGLAWAGAPARKEGA